MLSALENGRFDEMELEKLRKAWRGAASGSPFPAARARVTTPVIGLTGTGGAGKSSVVDELLLRFLHAFPEMRIAVLAVDPTRRRSGGALLGDRIRMNSLRSKRVFMRSDVRAARGKDHALAHYSCRRASIGFRPAARRAGKYPNTTPIAAAMAASSRNGSWM